VFILGRALCLEQSILVQPVDRLGDMQYLMTVIVIRDVYSTVIGWLLSIHYFIPGLIRARWCSDDQATLSSSFSSSVHLLFLVHGDTICGWPVFCDDVWLQSTIHSCIVWYSGIIVILKWWWLTCIVGISVCLLWCRKSVCVSRYLTSVTVTLLFWLWYW